MDVVITRGNRLADSDSPYLLQHAHNPVDWYPWGEEAFHRAKELDLPIFLSIGYSTCHWCHVMAEESFEDEEVANLLNKRFVPVKVDREERPDIDMIYIDACQTATGSAGWPLTAICTPDGRPFFLGTYFPPRSKRGRTGLIEILATVSEHWKRSRAQAEQAAEEIMATLRRLSRRRRIQAENGGDPMLHAVDTFKALFDKEYGGFGHAPKFPMPTNILFLLRQWHGTQDETVREMVETTLTGMYRGGIFDHIGGGFHRYSTDERWLVPHFEKMLYDNALLVLAYLEAFQAFGKPLYRSVAQRVFRYVLRDMQHPDGGFYAAEDADSEGMEGKFYVWRRGEILHALPSPVGEEFCRLYDIAEEGNFEGENIPNLLSASDSEVEDVANMQPWLDHLQRLRTYRERPHCDDKILTGWNGLMIAALARGYRVLGDAQLLQAARAAVEFILNQLVDGEGRLYASFRKRRGVPAFLDDYAFFGFGLLELFEATQKEQYLSLAAQFTQGLLELFSDPHEPGLFFTSGDPRDLPLRPKSVDEGALPSGTAIAMWNLAKLARLEAGGPWDAALARLVEHAWEMVQECPWYYPSLLIALRTVRGQHVDITITGDLESPPFAQLWAAVNSLYLPDAAIRFQHHGTPGECTAQVCLAERCLPPVSDPIQLIDILDKKKASV